MLAPTPRSARLEASRRILRVGTMRHIRTKYETRRSHLWRNLRWQWFVLFLVVFLGAAGIKYLEDWLWIDAFYFTVVTATTVGYGDDSPDSCAAKVWTVGLILSSFWQVAHALCYMAAFPLEWRRERDEFKVITQFGVNLVQE